MCHQYSYCGKDSAVVYTILEIIQNCQNMQPNVKWQMVQQHFLNDFICKCKYCGINLISSHLYAWYHMLTSLKAYEEMKSNAINSQRPCGMIWLQWGCSSLLTHWGWVMHICVSKLTISGWDNGFSPGWHQAIIWTNAGILLIEPSVTNFSEILI